MSLSESRKKKLEILTRSLATRDIRRAQAVLDSAGGKGRRTGSADPGRTADAGGEDRASDGAPEGDDINASSAGAGPRILTLETAAPGEEKRFGKAGKFWFIHRRLAEVSGDYLHVQREYAAVLRGARQRFDEIDASAGLCHVADCPPEGPLFMDIETCGLAGACIFLVGLMAYREGELVFEQLLARHYGEEAAILAAFARQLESAGALVTFNGKSFDMNCIRERSAFHGVELDAAPPHLDLLHDSRKRWRKSLPNCRLQTLEQYLCKRRRVGDIPGAEIPEAYHRFVAGGNATQLKAILHHNLLDLLTMSQLLCALLTGEQPSVDF